MSLWQIFCFGLHMLFQVLYPVKNSSYFCWKDSWNKQTAELNIFVWQADGELLYEIPISTAKPTFKLGNFHLQAIQVQALLLDPESIQSLVQALKKELKQQGLDKFSISVQSQIQQNENPSIEPFSLHKML